MPVARYWRLVGFAVDEVEALEISEMQFYAGGVLANAGSTISCTFAPTSGTLAALNDGSTAAVVSWSAAQYTSAGFALVWDFGAGGGIDLSRIRIGAGSGATTFPRDFTAQYSDDGLFWVSQNTLMNVVFPGAGQLVEATHLDNEVVCNFDGPNGANLFADSRGLAVHAVGEATLNTAQAKFGASSARFNGTGTATVPQDAFLIAPDSAFNFGTGDFTVEFFMRRNTATIASAVLVDFGPQTAPGIQLIIYLKDTNLIGCFISGADRVFGGPTTTTNWQHVALSRQAGTSRVFHDGQLFASFSDSFNYSVGSVVTLGRLASDPNIYGFNGWIDEFRVTKGIARHTANFTPPIAPFTIAGQATDTVKARWRAPPSSLYLISGSESQAFNLNLLPQRDSCFDAYYGGIFRIAGTVAEKGNPTNLPLRRRVLLLDERSQLVIREVWSNAVTGAYEFRGIRNDIAYTVVTYDSAKNYRAVIADNLMPELMPGVLP